MRNFKKLIAMIIAIATVSLTLVSCDMAVMNELLQDASNASNATREDDENKVEEDAASDDSEEETTKKKEKNTSGLSWSDIFGGGNKQPPETATNVEIDTMGSEYDSMFYPEREEWPEEAEGEFSYELCEDEEGYYYTLMDIGSWKGRNLIIPSEHDGIPVKKIGYSAFMGAYGIESLIVSEGIEEIDMWAFGYCEKLSKVSLPSTLNYMSERVFTYSPMIEYLYIDGANPKFYVADNCIIDREFANLHTAFNSSNFPYREEIRQIGSDAFRGVTSLYSIQIPDSVEIIGAYAFYDCSNLHSIEIGESYSNLRKIELGAFAYCSSLNYIYMVNGGNDVYRTGEQCIIENQTGTLALGCMKTVMPDDGSITAIGMYAFAGCTRLYDVRIPDSVKAIEREAFHGCYNLKSVYLPEGLETIGYLAFADTRNLYEIELPSTAIYIDDEAFRGNPALDPDYNKNDFSGSFGEGDKVEYSTSIVFPDGSFSESWTGSYIEIGSGNGYFEIVTGMGKYEIVTDEEGNTYYYYYAVANPQEP